MVKNKRGLLLIFCILFIPFLFPKNIDALSYKSDVVLPVEKTISNENDKYYSYTINSYDINMIVNENNTLYITEKIGTFKAWNLSKIAFKE